MNTLLLALVVSVVSPVATENVCRSVRTCDVGLGTDAPVCRQVQVCDSPKPLAKAKAKKHKKRLAHKPPVTSVPPPPAVAQTPVFAPHCDAPREVTVVRDRETRLQPVVYYVETKKFDCETKPQSPPFFVWGPHVALGLGARFPHTSGLVGVRAELSWFGLEAYSAFAYGWGGQALFYPYRGKRFAVNLTLGVLGGGHNKVSVTDVYRTWDVTAGAGLEYRIWKGLTATLDWRLSAPNPVYILQHDKPVYDATGAQVYGPAGEYLDVKHVLQNSLAGSHALVGAMWQF